MVLPVRSNIARDGGVDGLGTTIEEVAAYVASGRMMLPPLGIYRDAETYERYRLALQQAKLAQGV